MRRSVLFAAFLSVVPAAALAMSGYGNGNFSIGQMSPQGPGMEDYTAAIKLMNRGAFGDAIPFLTRALQAQPGNADILNYLGFTSRMVGSYDASLDYYQRALTRNPDHKGAHEYLGELYLTIHQLGNARGQLAELERLCPNGCLERETLTKSIAAYETAADQPATPSASSTPAPASDESASREATGTPAQLGQEHSGQPPPH
jgi:tetratricopeptide (TPR) repeat protein